VSTLLGEAETGEGQPLLLLLLLLLLEDALLLVHSLDINSLGVMRPSKLYNLLLLLTLQFLLLLLLLLLLCNLEQQTLNLGIVNGDKVLFGLMVLIAGGAIWRHQLTARLTAGGIATSGGGVGAVGTAIGAASRRKLHLTRKKERVKEKE